MEKSYQADYIVEVTDEIVGEVKDGSTYQSFRKEFEPYLGHVFNSKRLGCGT